MDREVEKVKNKMEFMKVQVNLQNTNTYRFESFCDVKNGYKIQGRYRSYICFSTQSVIITKFWSPASAASAGMNITSSTKETTSIDPTTGAKVTEKCNCQ